MQRVAAIDCGTNSIRLLIADLDGDTLRDVDRRMEIVRLGQGVDATGRLAPEAIERTRIALADYAAAIGDLDRVRMVATSATRDAANTADFDAMVHATLGRDAEVITGHAEAALSYVGAIRGLPVDTPPYLVVDIGGGSTEFVLGDSECARASRSVEVGCVRLTERHLRDDPPTPPQIEATEADIQAALAQVRETVPLQTAATVIGVAGTVTTVAAVAMDLPEYDAERIHASTLSARQVDEVTMRLLSMPHAQRAAIGSMHPGRVDVIGAGALVLRTLVAELGVAAVVVSEHDILDGIAWSLA